MMNMRISLFVLCLMGILLPVAPVSAGANSCASQISGPWTFTDTVLYGPGTGTSYSFNVTLVLHGSSVAAAGDLAFTGSLSGCTLKATFGQGNASGTFNWQFDQGGRTFTGTFASPSYQNGGSSNGTKLPDTRASYPYVVPVGDFDVSLPSSGPFNATSSDIVTDANFYVTVSVKNSRGTGLESTDLDFDLKLVDSRGVAHSPVYCSDCPNLFGDYGSASLVPGGPTTGNAYFKLPTGATPVSVLFQPFLSATSANFCLNPADFPGSCR
jgi:hypothetical protein